MDETRPGVRQHVHMTADDPGVGQFVVAEQRFPPKSVVPLLRPGMPEEWGRPHVGLFRQDFRDVIRAVAEFVSGPGEIENPDKTVLFRRTDLRREGQFTTQSVRGRPRHSRIDQDGTGILPLPCRRKEGQDPTSPKASHHKVISSPNTGLLCFGAIEHERKDS